MRYFENQNKQFNYDSVVSTVFESAFSYSSRLKSSPAKSSVVESTNHHSNSIIQFKYILFSLLQSTQ